MAFIDFDIKTTCRVCLTDCPDVISLFNSEYCKLLKKCANVEVTESDGLPSGICEMCIKEMLQAYKFVLKCQEADERLRHSIKNVFVSSHSDHGVGNKSRVEVSIKEEFLLGNDSGFPEFTGEIHLSNRPSSRATAAKEKQTEKSKKKFKASLSDLLPPCSVCGLVVKSNSAMATHVRTHSGEKLFECSDCGTRFTSKGNMKGHILRLHSNSKRMFHCETCGKDFFRKKELVVHTRRHTGETPYACSYCPRSFSQQSSLIRHTRTHTGERPYACKICNKKFANLTCLSEHRLVHTDEKKFTCDICHTSVKSKESLAKHKIIHTGVKSHICEVCGLSFLFKGSLKHHLQNVHSEKSGECTVCNKRFSNLEDHLRKHTGETPFQCHICSRCFAHKSSLSAHVNKHQNADKFPCTVQGCSKKFPVQSMLDFHILKHHNHKTPHVCPQCGRGFFRCCDLNKHLRTCHSIITSFDILLK